METYIILILILAVVAGGGYYLMQKKKKSDTQEENFSAGPEIKPEEKIEEKQDAGDDM